MPKLKWKPKEGAVKYILERRALGANRHRGAIGQALSALTKPVFGGWRKIATLPGTATSFEDDGVEFPLRRFLRPTMTGNSSINDGQRYQYRITPYDDQNIPGLPSYGDKIPAELHGPVDQELQKEQNRYVHLDMTKTATVNILVTDTDGNPISNAEVTIAANRR